MLLTELKSLDEALSKEKQQLFDIIYGKSGGPKLADKISNWLLNNLIFQYGENTPRNPKHIQDKLVKLGYSKEQMAEFRDLFTQVNKSVMDYLSKKHKDAIPTEYISAMPSSYGVYNLYLNVAEKYHVEFKKIVSEIFLKKLEKLDDSKFIPENNS
jgi:hypothetical protein